MKKVSKYLVAECEAGNHATQCGKYFGDMFVCIEHSKEIISAVYDRQSARIV